MIRRLKNVWGDFGYNPLSFRSVKPRHGLTGALALSLLIAPARAPASAPAGRYTAAGGVVKDNKTGLYWQQAVAPMLQTYASAMTYCSGNGAGLSGIGWRLPAIKELQTLVDDSIASPGPTIDSNAFPATPPSFFWSSTSYDMTPASFAWTVFFNDGSTSAGSMETMLAVRCVR